MAEACLHISVCLFLNQLQSINHSFETDFFVNHSNKGMIHPDTPTAGKICSYNIMLNSFQQLKKVSWKLMWHTCTLFNSVLFMLHQITTIVVSRRFMLQGKDLTIIQRTKDRKNPNNHDPLWKVLWRQWEGKTPFNSKKPPAQPGSGTGSYGPWPVGVRGGR